MRNEKEKNFFKIIANRTPSRTNTRKTIEETMYKPNHLLSMNLKAKIYDMSPFHSLEEFISSRIENNLEKQSFMICNLLSVIDKYRIWKSELPFVEPFYAVKCNPDPVIIRLLASLGCGFDCATSGEINFVIKKTGNHPKTIVYANPAKMSHMLKFAIENNVDMTVFDGEDELYKIAKMKGGKNLKLLLRLATDDSMSICRFSNKFGCSMDEVSHLLQVAKKCRLNVVGVSFHVGSGCRDATAYTKAFDNTITVFETVRKLGMPDLSIVDIGGGFMSYCDEGVPSFKELADAVRRGAHSLKAKMNIPDIRFIAEPGRFFVSESVVLATKIYSRRGGNSHYQSLYVDDGIYGSFNNVLYDHFVPIPRKLETTKTQSKDKGRKEDLIPTSIFGPTCDGLDQLCSLETTVFPRCEIDDWIIWKNMGAYTHSASFFFNGYTHIPSKIYVV